MIKQNNNFKKFKKVLKGKNLKIRKLTSKIKRSKIFFWKMQKKRKKFNFAKMFFDYFLCSFQ